MYSFFLLICTSFLFALLLTPLIRDAALACGLVDRPDDKRHLHAHSIPRLGGVAILIAYLAAVGVVLLFPLSAGRFMRAGLPLASKVTLAALVVFAAGLTDDVRGLKPWQKLAAQLAAAGLAFWAGIRITGIVGFPLPLWLSVLVTVIWLVGCSNAFNLIDGVDGLAAGAGLFATVTILLGGLLNNNMSLALATAPLAGALLGFLRYNFNPASIFLGDCGSLLVGFSLGCFGVVWSQKSTTLLGMTAPMMALAIPLLDTALAVGRRFLRQQPLFNGDRGHIHHRLLERGLTPRRVALLLYGACDIAACLSLLQNAFHNSFGGLIVVTFCAAAWLGVQHLGYTEFGLAGRMLIAGAFRHHLTNQIALKAFEDSLRKARTPEDCWLVIREAAREFGFVQVEVCLNGRVRSESLAETNGEVTWSIDIPLEGGDYVKLFRPFSLSFHPTVLSPFADALHKSLSRTRPVSARSAKA